MIEQLQHILTTMQLSWEEIRDKATIFSKRWEDARSEKSEAQSFIRDFLAVFGVDDAPAVGTFEDPALRESGDGYMDYFWSKKIAVEMKSKGKGLQEAYEQLKDYVLHLPTEKMPELLMVSDFETITLYHRITAKKASFKTANLSKHVRRFALLAGYETTREIQDQLELNILAAEKMAKLHESLSACGYEGHDLEVFLVRLLFCLFAEDTEIFEQDSFLNYVQNSKEDGSDLSGRIARLFDVLDTPPEKLAKMTGLPLDLKRFCHVNGNLFAVRLPLADFDEKMRKTLVDCCLFDWSKISPAIFGSMFQGVMDKTKRRDLGAHYTSETNILKVINTLFMDDLWAKFERSKTKASKLKELHTEISRLKFLDPACGCGNFLMLAYRELRRLEHRILTMLHGNIRQKVLDVSMELKVSVEQFYGIEIEDFPCEVAKVGMWLTDHQMNQEVTKLFGKNVIRLPLTEEATIIHGNALRTVVDGQSQPLDWESIVSKEELSYIFGNPPYVGHQWRSVEQQKDMQVVFKDNNKSGKLDYVCCWYKKAADYIIDTKIRVAFVSTNSIVQGESVAVMWEPFFDMGIEIDFAYRTFKWSNEAKGKAAVHCVIISFSCNGANKTKCIYADETAQEATHINGYLIDAPNIFIQSRGKPLSKDMPEMSKGSQPTDGGHLILSAEGRDELIAQYPQATSWIKQYISANDFINGHLRYCLWLKGVPSKEYRSIKPIMQRLESVAEMRKASPTASVRRDAETPMLFTQIRQPQTRYLVVPEVSSERRKYIPIGYMAPNVIASNMVYIIPDATLYLFGIMTSNVHMAWMRVVCGRLKSDYRYTPSVYNNFPWPETTDKQKATVETLAQAVLDARALFPDSSLADLYGTVAMQPELLKAHKRLDRAVMKLYGFKSDWSESKIVAALMERYQELCVKQKPERSAAH